MPLYGSEPNAYTYGYLTKGLCEKGRVEQGLGFYKEMRSKGMVPSGSCYMVLICSLAMDRRLDEAVEVVFDMLTNSLSPDMLTYNTVLAELCREGRGNEALELLEDWKKRDPVMGERNYRTLMDEKKTADVTEQQTGVSQVHQGSNQVAKEMPPVGGMNDDDDMDLGNDASFLKVAYAKKKTAYVTEQQTGVSQGEVHKLYEEEGSVLQLTNKPSRFFSKSINNFTSQIWGRLCLFPLRSQRIFCDEHVGSLSMGLSATGRLKSGLNTRSVAGGYKSMKYWWMLYGLKISGYYVELFDSSETVRVLRNCSGVFRLASMCDLSCLRKTSCWIHDQHGLSECLSLDKEDEVFKGTLTKGMSKTGSLQDGVQLAETLGTVGVRSPQVSVLWGTVKHIRQGVPRGISFLHSSGRSNASSDVQQVVSRSGTHALSFKEWKFNVDHSLKYTKLMVGECVLKSKNGKGVNKVKNGSLGKTSCWIHDQHGLSECLSLDKEDEVFKGRGKYVVSFSGKAIAKVFSLEACSISDGGGTRNIQSCGCFFAVWRRVPSMTVVVQDIIQIMVVQTKGSKFSLSVYRIEELPFRHPEPRWSTCGRNHEIQLRFFLTEGILRRVQHSVSHERDRHGLFEDYLRLQKPTVSEIDIGGCDG
ncbi:hypothetical protein F2Q70_00030119 [Brassica cretica]|uniref:Pentatricopeptide repeat-containing protein n=1 Tax=Brassica cretica TaxID=69181 RepID=A0A8S9FQV8_BRACR|nr:hypothetical protein F2Q70_00030119 [Brassica cretica]